MNDKETIETLARIVARQEKQIAHFEREQEGWHGQEYDLRSMNLKLSAKLDKVTNNRDKTIEAFRESNVTLQKQLGAWAMWFTELVPDAVNLTYSEMRAALTDMFKEATEALRNEQTADTGEGQ